MLVAEVLDVGACTLCAVQAVGGSSRYGYDNRFRRGKEEEEGNKFPAKPDTPKKVHMTMTPNSS